MIYKQNNTSNKAIIQAFFKLSSNKRKLLDLLIEYDNLKDGKSYPSVGRLAREIGVSHRTVLRYIQELKELNIITTEFRLFNTSIYTINSFFYKYGNTFKRYLPHLRGAAKVLAFMSVFGLSLIAARKPFVVPYQKDILINPSKREYLVLENKDDKGVKTRKERYMKTGELKISPILRDITQTMNLTRLGQAKLLMFSDEALQSVWPAIKPVVPTLQKPFNYLFTALHNHISQQNITLDVGLYNLILTRYDISPRGNVQFPPKAPQMGVPALTTNQRVSPLVASWLPDPNDPDQYEVYLSNSLKWIEPKMLPEHQLKYPDLFEPLRNGKASPYARALTAFLQNSSILSTNGVQSPT